jgi:hypothetical protein
VSPFTVAAAVVMTLAGLFVLPWFSLLWWIAMAPALFGLLGLLISFLAGEALDFRSRQVAHHGAFVEPALVPVSLEKLPAPRALPPGVTVIPSPGPRVIKSNPSPAL